MIDVDKQVRYWRDGAAEDWEVALHLIGTGRNRHGLFFVHLALEKSLKAIVCQHTQDSPPRIHNLIALYKLADVSPNREQIEAMAKLNAFQMEGRYPEDFPDVPTSAETNQYLKSAKELMEWLTHL